MPVSGRWKKSGGAKDGLDALRKALMETVADFAAMAAAEKLNISLQPKTARDIDAVIAKFKSVPSEMIKKVFAMSQE